LLPRRLNPESHTGTRFPGVRLTRFGHPGLYRIVGGSPIKSFRSRSAAVGRCARWRSSPRARRRHRRPSA